MSGRDRCIAPCVEGLRELSVNVGYQEAVHQILKLRRNGKDRGAEENDSRSNHGPTRAYKWSLHFVPFPRGISVPWEPGLLWHIYGEKGEIRVSCDDEFLQIGLFDPVLKVLDHATTELKVIELPKDEFESLPRENKNIARLHEAFAKTESENLVDFEKAVVRYRFLDEVFKSLAKKRQGQYRQTY